MQDRKRQGSSPDDIELLKPIDRNRKEKRQFAIAMQNQNVVEAQISPEYKLTPEELLIRDQKRAFAKQMLLDALLHFEQDSTVKEIIVAVLVKDIDFRSTRDLADKIGCNVKETHAAKERLKYFVQSDKLKAVIVSSM